MPQIIDNRRISLRSLWQPLEMIMTKTGIYMCATNLRGCVYCSTMMGLIPEMLVVMHYHNCCWVTKVAWWGGGGGGGWWGGGWGGGGRVRVDG